MTDLTRPVAGDPLSSSNGKASTVILDEAFDVIEANEDALAVRTSQHIVTTTQYSDIAEVLVNAAEATTGWHVVQSDTADSDPGPSTNAAHSQGTLSVQAYLKSPSGDLTPSLYVNLTEAGYATGLDVTPGQHVLVDILLAQTVAESPFTNAFTRYAVTLASGVDMTGTLVQRVFVQEDVTTFLLNTWYTIDVNVGTLTNIRSIGIKKVLTGGSGTARARWRLDNIRRAGTTPLDQAYAAQNDVAVLVPPDYTTTAEQLPLASANTKSILDLRPTKIHGGVRWLNDYQIDTTGTTDVTEDLQAVLDSLEEGDILMGSPDHVYLVNGTLDFDVAGVTFDFNGAKLYQDTRGIERICVLEAPRVTLKNGHIFGYTASDPANTTGSTMTTVAGTPANSLTTKVLATTGDEVRIPIISGTTLTFGYSRDYQFRNRFDFTLHDTIPAAGDCVVQIKDSKTGTVLQTTTLTLTTTPTLNTVYFTPGAITQRLIVTVKKAAGTGNVVVTDFIHYGWSSFNTINEENFGVAVTAGGDDCVVENFLIEGVSGDGIGVATSPLTTAANRFVARDVTIRNVGRQGIAPCGGQNHQFINCTVIFGARHAVDLEPETSPDAIDGCLFKNFWVFEPQLLAFSSAAGWSRTRNVHVEDAYFQMNTAAGAVGGGYNGAHFSNVTIVRTDDPTTDDTFPSAFTGRNITLDNWKMDEGLQFNDPGTQVDDAGVTQTPGGHVARNITFTKTPHMGYINVLSSRTHLENITVESAGTSINTTYTLGGIGLMPDTTFTNVNLTLHRTQLANSYPGIATQAWFPGGLDARNEPLSRVRALSGGSTKGNNLGRLAQSVAAASTTATVTFPSRTYQNFSLFTLASSTGGTLTPAATYFYRIAGRSRRGGPIVAMTEKSVTLTAITGNATLITCTTPYSTGSGIAIEGVTIYRGIVAGTYNTRFDVVPTADLAGWGTSGANNTVQFKDLGTTVAVAGGNNFYQGYTFPYSTASGSLVPADETGFEPDTSYAVFIEPSWQTTWRISTKRTNGFDLEFGVACPTGGGTVNWMIARF